MTLSPELGKSLSVEQRADGVAVLRFDRPGEPVNTLQAEFAAEFEGALAALEGDANVKAVVLASGKVDSFIVGADIKITSGVFQQECETLRGRYFLRK